MHHGDFGDVSLREYHLITSARREAKNQEFRAWRVLNQELGILIQFAFHEPKRMPDFTKAKENQKSGTISGKAGAARLHQFLLGQSLQSKKGG